MIIIVIRALAKICTAVVTQRSAGNAVASLDSMPRIAAVLPARRAKQAVFGKRFFRLESCACQHFSLSLTPIFDRAIIRPLLTQAE